MKHADILQKMTIEEKAAFLSGKSVWETRDIPRLMIPSIFCADGPHGLRKQAGEGDHLGLNASQPATCFPTAATIANSWDLSLGEEIGEALGEEAAALGVHVLLGPGLNIKRSPLCGRNFEYFSEDPFFSGKMAASYIRGIQRKGVYACPKHFAVNSQESRRMVMNSVLDERTLREIYLEGFEIAVKEGGARAIMSSYNEVNGIYANENKHLLQEILRNEWGFEGIVITDWGGSNDHALGVAAGSNLEMPAPGYDSARELISAVESGKITKEELDSCVDDLLDAVLTLANQKADLNKTYNKEAHHNLARRAAQESMVLLKNNEKLLPLNSGSKVAIIGDFAFTPRYQGAGSSMVNPTALESIIEVIDNYNLVCIGNAQGYKRDGDDDAGLKKTALNLAGIADVVLFFFGLDEISESEGMDRNHMRIPQNQIDLLESLVKVNANIVGILSAGAVVEMPWQNCCRAIVHGFLNGQAGASAIMDVITGKVNPSGRLNETYPLRYEDTPAFHNFPSIERNAEYRESIFVGYRYYITSKVRFQYPFGYGLSYTTFEYSDLLIEKNQITFRLTNTGNIAGAEVPQLYVGCNKSKLFRAERELKGFTKIFLKAGESILVTIPFDDKTFRYWNTGTNNWEIEEGEYTIQVGASVIDIRLSGQIKIEGTTDIIPYNKEKLPMYYTGLIQNISNLEFEELLGYPIPSGKWSGKLGLNDALCQMFYARSKLARLIYRFLTKLKNNSEEKGKPDLNILFIYNMPFRGIAKMTNGAVSMEMARGMVLAANGHLLKGLRKIIGGYFSNRRKNRSFEKKIYGKKIEQQTDAHGCL